MIRLPGTSLFPLLLPPYRTEHPLPLPPPPPPPLPPAPPPPFPTLIVFVPAPDLPVSPNAALFFLPFFLVSLMFIAGKRSVRVAQWSEWSYVTAQWSEWGPWSACSSTCFGIPGVRIRTHTCPTNPPTCQGDTSENEACMGETPCEIT